MSRPRLGLGQNGEIWVVENARGRFVARTTYRGLDGRTRDITASGGTKLAARTALTTKLSSVQSKHAVGITSEMTIEQATASGWSTARKWVTLAAVRP